MSLTLYSGEIQRVSQPNSVRAFLPRQEIRRVSWPEIRRVSQLDSVRAAAVRQEPKIESARICLWAQIA